MSEVAQIPEIKQALEARIFLSDQILAKLDQCFKLIGEKPVKATAPARDIPGGLSSGVCRDSEPFSKTPVHPGEDQPPDPFTHSRVHDPYRSWRYDRSLCGRRAAGELPGR